MARSGRGLREIDPKIDHPLHSHWRFGRGDFYVRLTASRVLTSRGAQSISPLGIRRGLSLRDELCSSPFRQEHSAAESRC